jgi:hypothetical protein
MCGLNRTLQSILSALAVMSLLLVSPVAFAQAPPRPTGPADWLAELKPPSRRRWRAATGGQTNP